MTPITGGIDLICCLGLLAGENWTWIIFSGNPDDNDFVGLSKFELKFPEYLQPTCFDDIKEAIQVRVTCTVTQEIKIF